MTSLNEQEWLAKNPDVDSITVAVCDINGVLRGKRIPVDQLKNALSSGVRMPQSACTLDIFGRDIEDSELVLDSGDADGVCVPTARGVITRSWDEKPSGFLQVMLGKEDGTPVGADSRQALATVLKRFKEKGLTPVVAMEMEFYLTSVTNGIPRTPTLPDAHRPLAMDNILSVSELDALSDFFDDIYVACNAHGIAADSAVSEGGAGQYEINLLHTADAMKAADDALLFKTIVKSIARQHGFHATFMAKPFGDTAGNGLHVHFSVVDEDGKNIFDDGTDKGSEALQFAVGGLIKAMQESTLIFAPHQNSYRRMRPGSFAPISAAWGYENRSCAIRIPGGTHAARRIEHRVSGADANPYLMLAVILGAALIGIEDKILPPPPLRGNAYEANAPQLPLDWLTAIVAFSSGTTIARILDPLLVRLYAQAKHQELTHFLGIVSGAEYHAYLETV